MQQKTTQERELRERVRGDAKLAQQTGNAWDDIAQGAGALSRRSTIAICTWRAARASTASCSATRASWCAAPPSAPSRTSSGCASTRTRICRRCAPSLLAATPIYPDFETGHVVVLARQDARIARPRRRRSCASCWARNRPSRSRRKLVRETKLADPAVRKALWEGGAAAVDASQDPMIALARDDRRRRARACARSTRTKCRRRVAAAQEKIAKARFAVLGTNIYPDATFTLRLSYGAVEGWTEKGAAGRAVHEAVAPVRAHDRQGSVPPAAASGSMRAASSIRNTPFNYVTTNDIVGGNSGSPLVDAQGRLVGLAFDGNIHSIAGSYWYDEKHESRGRRASRHHPHGAARRVRRDRRSRTRSSASNGSAQQALALLRRDRELDVQAVLHFERAERHAERLDAELRLQDVELAAARSAFAPSTAIFTGTSRRGSRP